jgi:hypothetical protein
LAWIINWAPHQGSVDDASYSDVKQGFDLLWVQVTTSIECKKVSGYSLFQEGAAKHGRKGAHRSSNQPVKADGHSSSE